MLQGDVRVHGKPFELSEVEPDTSVVTSALNGANVALGSLASASERPKNSGTNTCHESTNKSRGCRCAQAAMVMP